MDCNQVKLLVVEHVLPFLRDPAVDWSAVAGHIGACAICREECEQGRRAISLLEAALGEGQAHSSSICSGAGKRDNALDIAMAPGRGRPQAAGHPPSDADLILRVIEDDRPAFETIYLRYRQSIMNFIGRRWSQLDYHAAEDTANEVFLQIWRNRYRLGAVNNLHAYLKSTAQNLLVDRFRGRRHEQRQLPCDVPWAGPSASTTMELREIAEQIHEAMASLAGSHRVALELSQVGLSAREIASRCGCSEKAAQRRIEKSRERLKSALSYCGSSCARQADRPDACPAKEGRVHCLKWLYMHGWRAAYRRKQDQQGGTSGSG